MGKCRIDCSKDKPLTQQSSKDECDINLIVERAKRGADLSALVHDHPMYGDFTVIPTDLRECMVKIKEAEAVFMTLDPKVRFRFHNDPAEMLDFLNNESNRKEAIDLGLVEAPVEKPAPPAEPSKSEVVSPK